MNTFVALLSDAWLVLCEMAPFLLFGFMAAGILSVLIKPEAVEKHLGRAGVWSAVKASLIGVPLPLCSCSVIPVAVSMHKHGASRGAVTSFLLSTPQTGVDSVLVTFALLAPVFGTRFALIFSVFRPVAAFITGVVGGAIVELTDPGRPVPETQNEDEPQSCCASTPAPNRFKQMVTYAVHDLPADIAKPLLVGIFISAMISVAVPDDFFAPMFGSGLTAMLVLMALSIPIYVCDTGSVPVVVSLIVKGVSPGAAFAFLVAGPATNVATIATVWSKLGRRATGIYLGTVVVSAIVFGFVINSLLPNVKAVESAHAHEGMPAWLTIGSAVLLLVLLVKPLIPRMKTKKECCD